MATNASATKAIEFISLTTILPPRFQAKNSAKMKTHRLIKAWFRITGRRWIDNSLLPRSNPFARKADSLLYSNSVKRRENVRSDFSPRGWDQGCSSSARFFNGQEYDLISIRHSS